jgi:hypothetical protein
MGFVVDKVALGQVLSEYFGFPCQFAFHRLFHIHHLPSGAGTIGQKWPQYKGLSPTPLRIINKIVLLFNPKELIALRSTIQFLLGVG